MFVSGVPGVIYNGVPDWLYQEEVLPQPEAVWPSADGSHILYATFNDSKVSAFQFPWFGTQPGVDGLYTTPLGVPHRATFPPLKSIRYPIPGSANPEVDMWVINVQPLMLLQQSANSSVNSSASNITRTKVTPPMSLVDQ